VDGGAYSVDLTLASVGQRAPSSDVYAISGLAYSGGAEIVGLVVSIVPARAEVHLPWGIDTMSHRDCTYRAGWQVVCFVVLIVVATGDIRVLCTHARGGRFSSTSSLRPCGAQLAAGGRVLSIRATENRCPWSLAWERIWERNAALRLRWGGMRRYD
jgi:hypothetical protein